jgi:hypothetical protein
VRAMIAIPAAVSVDLNQQGVPSARHVPSPPAHASGPKRSVAAARSWGDAMRSCRPAPGVTFMPTQRTLVAAMQSTVSDVALGRTRQRVDGTTTPASSRPSTAEAARAQQRASPRLRQMDAQWKLDEDGEYGIEHASVPQSPTQRPPTRLHALQAVPGAGVIGQHRGASAATRSESSEELDSGPAAVVDPNAAVRQLMDRREEQHQEAMRPNTPQRPRSSDRGPAVPRSPKAGTLRGSIDLGGTQHPRSATSAGVAESRRSTVRHIDDILNHPSRTPRHPDARGLVPDERSQASVVVVSSAQRFAAARLRREGMYVTGVVQPVLPPSVFCRDQHPRMRDAAAAAKPSRKQLSSPSQPVQQQLKRERVTIGPFADGEFEIRLVLSTASPVPPSVSRALSLETAVWCVCILTNYVALRAVVQARTLR